MKYLLICLILLITPTVTASQVVNIDNIGVIHEIKSAKQWGIDAINIPNIVSPINTNVFGLNTQNKEFLKKHLLFKHELEAKTSTRTAPTFWLTNSTHFLTPDLTIYKREQQLNSTNQLSVGFSNARFSAETTIIHSSSPQDDSASYQIQGAYKLYKQNNLTVAIAARLTLDESSDFHQTYQFLQFPIITNLDDNQQVFKATLGLVTTLHLTDNWQLVGTLSSQNIEDKVTDYFLAKDAHTNNATISTRYSF